MVANTAATARQIDMIITSKTAVMTSSDGCVRKQYTKFRLHYIIRSWLLRRRKHVRQECAGGDDRNVTHFPPLSPQLRSISRFPLSFVWQKFNFLLWFLFPSVTFR